MNTQEQHQGNQENPILNYKGEEVELNTSETSVLDCLKRKNPTIMNLVNECKITRPTNAIVTLRKKGFKIQTIWEKNEQTGTKYARYYLIKGDFRNGKNK